MVPAALGVLGANPDPGIRSSAPGARPVLDPQPTLGAAPTEGNNLVVNYAHDWVCAYSVLPDTPLQITVKRGGNVLAARSALTDSNRAYCSQEHNDWVSAVPNIQAGDSVIVTAGGATAAVDPIGEIAGTLDVATSTVSGALHAPALAPKRRLSSLIPFVVGFS